MIDWTGDRTEVLLNPRMPKGDAERVRRLIAAAGPLPGHVWVTTSGSTGRLKPVALSKRALLVSADAVNRHLEAGASDRWLNVLPAFHVGGLGVHARAYRNGATVRNLEAWNPAAFVAAVASEGITLSALVPTQVFDLVRASAASPGTLRAVIVGGGALDRRLLDEARALGWPLLPSYGATECASQIATATPGWTGGPNDLPLLSHVEVRTDGDGRIAVRSPALFTGYATERGLEDPKRDGWWRTDDLGAVRDGRLTVTGRADETVKIGGELVNLAALESRLALIAAAQAAGADTALVVQPDPRLGSTMTLVIATHDDAAADRVRDAFNAAVLPFERIRAVCRMDAIPRTAIGKVARGELARRARGDT